MKIALVAAVSTIVLLCGLVGSSDSPKDAIPSPFNNLARSRAVSNSLPIPLGVGEAILKRDYDAEDIDEPSSPKKPLGPSQTQEPSPTDNGEVVVEGEADLGHQSRVEKPYRSKTFRGKKGTRARGNTAKKKRSSKRARKSRNKIASAKKGPITLSGCAKATVKVIIVAGVALLVLEGVTYVLDPTHTASMWIGETVSSLLESAPSLETISGWVGSLLSWIKVSPKETVEELYICHSEQCMLYSVCDKAIRSALSEGGPVCDQAAECVHAIIQTAGQTCVPSLGAPTNLIPSIPS